MLSDAVGVLVPPKRLVSHISAQRGNLGDIVARAVRDGYRIDAVIPEPTFLEALLHLLLFLFHFQIDFKFQIVNFKLA